MIRYCYLFLLLAASALFAKADSETISSFQSGKVWPDQNGNHINAHGGGIVFHQGVYYWFGEHRETKSFTTHTGVRCYSSKDLYNWKDEGVALSVVKKNGSPIEAGCIIERPKVIYNEKTKEFVMYFHLELKGKGYEASQTGIATSKRAAGPYKLRSASRVNKGIFPLNMEGEYVNQHLELEKLGEWWTPEWYEKVGKGYFVKRDLDGGQMSRDMTLFVDDDGKAYHIYSSEENLTIHIAELTDDYRRHSGKYIRVEPGGHNEAPAIFKRKGKYYMITSGCTGWDPNEARLLVADEMLGEWTLHENPARGIRADRTFDSQSTFILPVVGKKDAFIFMADRWRPRDLKNSPYVWLPIQFEDEMPIIKWYDEWNLDFFDNLLPTSSAPTQYEGWNLVWNDEFNEDGKPNEEDWNYEIGFKRNREDQWYQRDNAEIKDGVLVIEGRLEHRKNRRYQAGSSDWGRQREYIRYSAASINTVGKQEFLYGRFEVRAKIPTAKGAWPAIWTLGNDMEWPSNGEIDIMEFYQIDNKPHILANAAWGTNRKWDAKWKSKAIPYNHFLSKDRYWGDQFHVWRMDWDEDYIRLYLDDELLNEIDVSKTINGALGNHKNPFKQPHYILLNLAIGGVNGGQIDDAAFPLRYEIDYVRVYQKKK